MKKYDKVYANLKSEVQTLFQTPGIIGVLTEKIDGCFPYPTTVHTNKGMKTIGNIVNNELDIKVLSIDENGNHQRAKFVSNKFKETKSCKIMPTISGFIEKYVTIARIQKKVDYFIDEQGMEIEPKLIGQISYMVLKDVIEEEFKAFLKLGIVDLGSLQKGIKFEVVKFFREELKLI